MDDGSKTREELLLEVDELRRQLAAAQATLKTREEVNLGQGQAETEQQGSIFTPEVKPARSQAMIDWPPNLMAQPDIPIKILLIEDNPGDAGLIREMLADAGAPGITIEWVPKLSQGLEYLSKCQVDLVLLDLGLPDSQGLETFCKAYTHTPEVPFVLLTGLDDETLALTAVQKGAQDYLIKGDTDGHKLFRAVRYANERRKVQEAMRRARDLEDLTGELAAARNLQQAVLEQMPAGVIIADPSGRIILTNRQAETIFRQPPGSLCDLEHFRQISRFHPDGRPCPAYDLPLWRALTLGETVVNEEFLLQRNAGDHLQAVNLNVSATPVRDQHGSIIAVVATYTDITGNKQAQAALLESEERYRSLVELSPDAILVHTGGKIVFVNPAAVKLFGATARGDLVGQPVMDRMHPDYHATVQNRITKVQSGGTVSPQEEKILRLDGEAVEVEAVGGAIIYQGRAAMQVVFRDITERNRSREALKVSNAKLQALIEASPLAIVHLERNGTIQSCNPATERIFGWQAEELLGRFFPVESKIKQKVVRNIIQRIFQGEPLTGLEVRGRRKDGAWIEVSLSGAPLCDEAGKVAGIVGLVEDITARKQAEAALAQSRAEFEAIFNSISDAIIFADQQRRIVLANPAVKALFGYDPEELIGRSSEVLYADRADFEAVREKYYPSGVLEKPALFEITYRRKNGTLFSAESLAGQVRDTQGKILGGVGIHRDITARKVALAALKESQRQVSMLADFLENSSQPFGVGYLDGRIGMFNEAFLQLLGYSQKELSRLNWKKDLTPPEWREQEAARLEELLRIGEPVRYEKEYLRKDSARVPVEMFVHLRRDEQAGALIFYAFVTDITARKRAEASLKESEERYRSLFEKNHAVMLLVDPETGAIVDANPAACSFYGYSRAKLTAMKVMDFNSLSPEQVFAAMHKARDGRQRRFQFHHRLAGGEIRDVEVYSGPIRIKGQDLLYSIIHDITARKEAEEALAESEARFRAIFENAAIGIALTDTDGRVLALNPSFEKSLGYCLPDLACKTFTDITHADDVQPSRDLFADLMSGRREHYRLEKRYICKDGSVMWVNLAVSLIRDASGAPRFSVGMVEDITARKQAEAALEQERQRLFDLLDSLPGLVLLSGPDYTTRFANRRFIETFGDPQDKSCFEIFHQRQAPCEGCPALSVIHNQTQHEWERNTEDGRTFQVYKYPFRDTDGTSCILTLGLDITARKQAEAALEQERQRLFDLLDSLPGSVSLKGPDYTIRFANRRFREAFGEPGKKHCYEVLYNRQTPCEDCPCNTIFDNQTFQEYERTFTDGRTVQFYKYPFLDTDGTACHLTLGLDITPRKQAETALKESEARFRQMAENLDDAILLASADLQRVHYISPAFERIWGRSCASLYQAPRSWLESVVPGDREKVRTALKDLIAGDLPLDSFPEFRITHPDGTVRWILARYFPIRNEGGEVYRIAGTATDITSRKDVEAVLRWRQEHLGQTAKMEAVGRLAGGVAHDFNNLLTVISGYGELLLADLQEADQRRQQVQAILKAAEQATIVTRQLLAFSRKQMLQPQILELNGLIASLVEMFRRLADENIRISMNLEPELGAVKADPSHMEQVVMNLAINAMDAMPQGGALTIETANIQVAPDDTRQRPEVAPGAYVVVTVTDTGIGMNREILSHIFEPFFTTKERGKGTGLGLSMAYGIIKQSGGYILVESTPQQGSNFRIYLPRVALAKNRAELAAPILTTIQDNGTILLVEDEAGVRHVVQRMLTLKGYSVLTAQDGQEALDIARGHAGPIHLLLTDVAMPVMGGRELAERLVPAHPEMRVLFMSGHTEDGMVRRGVRESFINFIQKPFRADQLLYKVRKLLAHSKP